MDEPELKKKIQEAFNSVAGGYDNPAMRFFTESARHLPQYLNLRGDEQVLDVATGTGNAALALADSLPHGVITGIDFSEGMLARARAKTAERHVRNIRLVSMDMQSLDFPDDAFDLAVLFFCLFFVEDMERQLRHVVSKVKSGGRVMATSFNDRTFSPLAEIFLEGVRRYGVETPSGWRRLSTPEECISLFEKTGLSGTSVDVKDVGYYLEDAGQWWDIVWNGGFRRYVSGIAPERLEQFKSEHLREIEGLSTGKGIWLEVKVLFSMGIKR